MGYDFNYVKRFHFWAHKILPLVYDESLSYYEFLCKVMFKLNETIEALNKQNENIEQFMIDEIAAREAFELAITTRIANIEGWLASPYSSSKTYILGDYVVFDEKFYKCTTAVTTPEPFDAFKWTQIVLADDIAEWKRALELAEATFEILMRERQENFESLFVEEYDETLTYQAGMYARYNDKLYRCLVNNTTGEFDPSDWAQVVLCTDLYSWKNTLMTTVTNWANAMDALRNNLVNDYDTSDEYAVGAYCYYNDVLYRCTTAVTIPGNFDPTKWTRVVLTEDLGNWKTAFETEFRNFINSFDNFTSAFINDFSTASTYNVGDYVYYEGNAYRCTTAVATAGDFDANDWTQVVITDDLKSIVSNLSTSVSNLSTAWNNFLDTYVVEQDYGISTTHLISQKGITELVMGQNLFNVDDEDVEYGVYYMEGVRTTDVSFNTSGYIPVTEGTTYYEKDGGTSPYYPVNFYDSSKNYVSGIRAADWPITVPSGDNIAYMRITFQNGNNCAVWLSSISSADWYFNPRYNDERIRGLTSQLNGYTISEPMTQTQYDNLSTYDSHTIYVIVG